MIGLFRKKTIKELISLNDINKIRKRLNPSNINMLDEDNRPPLYYAIATNNAELSALFLEWGAQLYWEEKDLDNTNTIIMVILKFNPLLLGAFLEKGVILPTSIDSQPLLHYCINHGCRNYSFYQLLLDQGCDIDELNSYGITALTELLNQKHSDQGLVKLLLEQGADANRGGSKQKSPLYTLFHAGHKADNEKIQLFSLLKPYIGPLSQENYKDLIQYIVTNKKAKLFLHILNTYNDIEIELNDDLLDFLTASYFTPSDQKNLIKLLDSHYPQLPIHLDILKAFGRQAIPSTLNGPKAFKIAIDMDTELNVKKQTLEEFIQQGGDINYHREEYATYYNALQYLVKEQFQHPDIEEHLQLLLELGISIETSKQSALLLATRTHSINLIKLLLRKGADPFYIDESGNSFLYELTDKDSKIFLNQMINNCVEVLSYLPKVLGQEDLTKLLYTKFQPHKDSKENTLIQFALNINKTIDRITFLKTLLDPPYSYDVDALFTSDDAEETPLLYHLINRGNDQVVEAFFEIKPDYKIPMLYGIFFQALWKKLNRKNLFSIIDHTEDLTLLDRIPVKWESYKELRYNYLHSLAFAYDPKVTRDNSLLMEIAEYLYNKGCDINQIARKVPRKEVDSSWLQESNLLVEAAIVDWFELFHWALNKGADVSVKLDQNKDNLIIRLCVALRNNEELDLLPYFELLTQKDPTIVTYANTIGKTPLIAAAQICNEPTIDWLIQKGAEIHTIGGFNGTTPLIAAIVNWGTIPINRRIKAVELLLNRGADINQVDKDKETPLMNACYRGALGVVQLLIERGADVNILDGNGRNAINHAVECRDDYQYYKNGEMNEYINSQIIEVLVKAGADMNVIPRERLPAIHLAVNRHYQLLTSTLIDLGVDINSKAEQGLTPLMWGIIKNNSIAIKTLLDHPNIDLSVINNFGENLWHFLSYLNNNNDRDRCWNALIKAQIPMIGDNAGKHPIQIALLNGNKDLVEMFLTRTDCVNVLDKENNTPLMYALMAEPNNLNLADRLKIVSLLISKGADINKVNSSGNSALKLSQQAGYKDITELLLTEGADTNTGYRKIGF
ncbi:ankyrin repeat domain-containing protein [Spirochaeta cellobiosiphila]|uniref:ankyrin repeat domain-containing protein n=1 Tax=Spirochaeta cellobiosiphila TaxID=504483 RepID=UPI00040D6FAB|nr:ankyrin repeat domain-containing protein [Spirochaeta cellobiosiphila]